MAGRFALQGLALGQVLTATVLQSLGLRKPRDGWRFIVGVGLREEHHKFAVASFGLKQSIDRIRRNLTEFLQADPFARCRLDQDDDLTVRLPKETVECAELQFNERQELTGIVWDGPSNHKSFPSLFQSVNDRPETRRPQELRQRLIESGVSREDADRLLSAYSIVVERVTDSQRFVPPALAIRRGLGFSPLTFIVRPFGETLDVWAYAHHTAFDGAPLQELMTRLETKWGRTAVTFPEPGSPAVVLPCHAKGERPVYESLSFHDFGPLLAKRKLLNANRPTGSPEVTCGALFMWELAQQPAYAGFKFGSTVDVPEMGHDERGVGMIPLKPADYSTVFDFAKAYDSELNLMRVQRGFSQEKVRTAAKLTPRLYRQMLATFPEVTNATFGMAGLSILRDASVFIAPYPDMSFPGGFLAIGNVNLPTVSGKKVGCVSVKGERNTVENIGETIESLLKKLA